MQEILVLVEDSVLEDEIEQADILKERLQQSLITTDRLITLKNAVPIVTTGGPHPCTTTATESRTEAVIATLISATHHSDPAVEGSGGMVKLPKLVQRKFNGDLTKWESFWSSFESSINLNTTLTAVYKFNYLNSLLEGPALAAVAGLKLTTADYSETLDTLKKRFGNKQQIISRHMDTLLELESVTSSNNTKALHRLYDQLEFQVRSLKSLEMPLDSYGNLLSSLFMNRLPQELRLIVSREVEEAEWRIDDILRESSVQERERAFMPSHGQPYGEGLPTVTALVAGDSQPECSYCRQGHSSSSCTVVTDVMQRKNILKKAGRCFMCLKRHHLSRDCRSPNRCACCKGFVKAMHANAQASNNSGARNQEPPRTQNQEATRPQNQAPQNSQNRTSTTQLYCVNTAAPVLLQTAQAYICKPNSLSYGMTIRLLLDGGSQRSYITQRVKTALGMEPHHVEEVQIKTFGSDSTTLQTVELTSVAISLKTGNSICVLFSTVHQFVNLCHANQLPTLGRNTDILQIFTWLIFHRWVTNYR